MSISVTAYNITSSSAFLYATWDSYPIRAADGYPAQITCNGQTVASQNWTASESLSGTISGLSQGTQYSATVTMWYDGGVASDTVYFTTYSPPPPPELMDIWVNSKTQTSVNLGANWSGYSGIQDAYISCNGSIIQGSISSSGSVSGTINSLSVSTSYRAYIFITHDDIVSSDYVDFTTDAPVVTVPTIGTLTINGLTVDMYFNIGSGNSYAEMEWYEDSTLIVAGNVYANPQPIQYTFAKSNTQYKLRMRGMQGTYPNAIPSAWTSWSYSTTGYPAVTVNPPTLGTPSVVGLTLTIPYTKGLNNQTLEFNIATVSGNVSSTNTDFVYVLPSYDRTYLVRARGVNTTNGITTYSEWTTPWLSITLNGQRPANWNWAVAKVQGASMTTTRQSSTLYYAYVITAADWNAFTDRILAFVVYKKMESNPSLVTFNTVAYNDNCNNVIIKQAIDNINLLLGSTQLYYSEVITAQLFNDMQQKLNSIP